MTAPPDSFVSGAATPTPRLAAGPRRTRSGLLGEWNQYAYTGVTTPLYATDPTGQDSTDGGSRGVVGFR